MTGVLAILGAGGHGRVVAECAELAGWTDIVFFDDAEMPDAMHWPVAGTTDDLVQGLGAFDGVVVAIGVNALRLERSRTIIARGGRLATLVHPNAAMSPRAVLGAGTVVLAGAVVSVGARLGDAVIVNSGATVDHDCILADGVHVSPGAHLAGGVTVRERSWIGIGAVVRELISIGSDVTIGAGAVVIQPALDGQTLVGNPARILER